MEGLRVAYVSTVCVDINFSLIVEFSPVLELWFSFSINAFERLRQFWKPLLLKKKLEKMNG